MKTYTLVLCFILSGIYLNAQQVDSEKTGPVGAINHQTMAYPRFYAGSNLDLGLLSSSVFSRLYGHRSSITTPRFTAIVNLGVLFHYDVSNKFGMYTGIGIKNIGFIEKTGDITIKRRVYSIGAPLGIKIGNLRNRNYFFLGGGLDIPFHYKEKRFEKRTEKDKISEWFGKQTAQVLPYAFIGYSVDPGITLKLQYYPTNFLNEDFVTINEFDQEIYPHAGYKVNLILLSLGIDIHYNQFRIQQKEYIRSRSKK